MEVYTLDEINRVVGLLEFMQDQMVIIEEDELYDVLQEAINILIQEDDE